MVLELIDTRLSIAGYRTFLARDGYQGLSVLKDCAPHAMILDINMPNLDGFGVLSRMQTQSSLPKAPTMVLTARNQTADLQRAIRLGASDFLTKPFDDQRLLSRVARLIKSNTPRSNGAVWA